MISWSARRWIWVEEQKRRQRWQRRRKFQREGWGRAIPEILVIMAMDRWRTLSRQGNVEPNLRISWISTVSPQTWPTAYEIVMILCKMYYKNIFLGVAWWSNNHLEISAWCPVSDTADTEERRESGLKLDVKFLKGAFLWIFANSWEREGKISVHSPHPLKLILCCSFWLEPVSKVPVLGRWPRTEVKEIRSRPKGVPGANSLPASSWLEGACCCQASRGRWCWFKGSTTRCRIGGNGGGNIHLGYCESQPWHCCYLEIAAYCN